MEKAIPPEQDVALRIAQQTLAARAPGYSTEVRSLLDAGREVMRRNGTSGRARVADIVALAGLSNDAFYRHFASKDMLVAAILEDGTERLRSYLAHQMGKAEGPEAKVRAWVAGVLAQAADEEVAAQTVAILWNSLSAATAPGSTSASTVLAPLLVEPFSALGSADPELDATLAAHAVIGKLSEHLWREERPTPAETDHIVRLLVAGVAAGGVGCSP